MNNDAMTTKDHLLRLIQAHRARLEVLEVQKAQQGYDLTPRVATEIDAIALEIAKLERQIEALDTVSELEDRKSGGDKIIDRRDSSNYDTRLHIMLATIQATVAEVASVKVSVARDIKRIETLVYRIAVAGVFAIVGLYIVEILK